MYSIDYFIDKLSKIPEEQWCTGAFQRSKHMRCALGHCGETNDRSTPEGEALRVLFGKCVTSIVSVNDGELFSAEALALAAPTPKERILNALRVIKESC